MQRLIRLAATATLVTPAVLAQPAAPKAMDFSIPEIEAALEQSGGKWREFLRRRSMTCGIYRLEAGSSDGQSPHGMDELYYVLSGRAVLEVGSQTFDAEPGALLFVQAGAEHRFVDITEDLSTLVFFSTAQPTRGGMAAGPRPTEQTPFDEASERGSARVFYWFQDSSAGQLDIQYGRPAWQPAFEAFLTKPNGNRWRLGENFWTTLDTNIPLRIGGVELGIGQHYLVLENQREHGVRLIALDPDEIRSKRLDAYEANETTGGVAIPLEHAKGNGSAARLAIELDVDRRNEHRAKLTIRFGPHTLTAPVEMLPE